MSPDDNQRNKERSPSLTSVSWFGCDCRWWGVDCFASGKLLGIPLSILAPSPLHDFLVPGLLLFFLVGLAPLVTIYALIEKRDSKLPSSLTSLTTCIGRGLLACMFLLRLFCGYKRKCLSFVE